MFTLLGSVLIAYRKHVLIKQILSFFFFFQWMAILRLSEHLARVNNFACKAWNTSQRFCHLSFTGTGNAWLINCLLRGSADPCAAFCASHVGKGGFFLPGLPDSWMELHTEKQERCIYASMRLWAWDTQLALVSSRWTAGGGCSILIFVLFLVFFSLK